MILQLNYINSVPVNSGMLFFFITPKGVSLRDRQIEKIRSAPFRGVPKIK
jgi:hypothetical protein